MAVNPTMGLIEDNSVAMAVPADRLVTAKLVTMPAAILKQVLSYFASSISGLGVLRINFL